MGEEVLWPLHGLGERELAGNGRQRRKEYGVMWKLEVGEEGGKQFW